MGMDFKNVEFPMKDILLAHAFDGLYNSESQKKFYNDYYYRKVRKMVSGKEGYGFLLELEIFVELMVTVIY